MNPTLEGSEMASSSSSTPRSGSSMNSAPNGVAAAAAPYLNGLASSFSRLRVMDNPPPEDPRVEDVEKIAATEMNQLSMQSREQILYDLHGISETILDETPEFLQTSLTQLQDAIHQLPDGDKEAYNLAMTMDYKYVTNSNFRLKFLRSDMFHPTKAAVRFTKHFQAKLELFDQKLLCKDITQDDLDDGALKCLYSGWIQELPIRDISGRLVSVLFQQVLDQELTVEDKLRSVWYRRMTNADEIETQRYGIVFIIFDSARAWDRVTTWKIGRLLSCLPVRFMAYHMCFQPEYYQQIGPIVALGRMAVDTFDRHRFRVHTGSPLELKYALQTFGIPVSSLPIDEQGVVSTEFNREFWMKQRVEENRKASETKDEGEEDNITSNRVTTPGKHDVLMGRGRSCQEHAGNVRFRYLIEQNLDRYDLTPKHKKMTIALEILNEIHARGGRFLSPSDTGWSEIDEVTAREKVSSCFRSFRKVKGAGKTPTSALNRSSGTVRKSSA